MEKREQRIVEFCSTERTGVASVDRSTGQLVLMRGKKNSHLNTTIDDFNSAVKEVSRDAWDLYESVEGRNLIRNFTTVGKTRTKISGKTIFSLKQRLEE